MTYKNYTGIATYDNEAQIYLGEVTGITDVITFQGRTTDELRQAFRESIDDYLDFAANKAPIPRKKCGE